MATSVLRLLAPTPLLVAVALGAFGGCAGSAEEGEACDRDNGNADCESGLICRGEWEIRAKESVCCPAPPAKPSVDACKPQIEHAHPDPTVDASYGAGGAGGTPGSGGSAGSGGQPPDSGDDAADAEPDAADGALDAPDLDSAADDGG
jgi:hypothetical protein